MKVHELLVEAKAEKGQAIDKIISYLERKLGTKLIKFPGVEAFSNSLGSGKGLRYVFDGSTKSVRFNWRGAPGAIGGLDSVDIWLGKSHDPDLHVTASGVSLVKVLPSLAKLLAAPRKGELRVFPLEKPEEKEVVTEARRGEWTPEACIADFIKQMEAGRSFTRSEFNATYHVDNLGIFDAAYDDFQDIVDIKNKRLGLAAISPKELETLRKGLLAKVGSLEAGPGGSDEQYEATPAEKEIEKRVPFAETLEHLDGLVKGLVKGAFNALFIAGKGGTGKTQTVEDALAAEGLSDGNGYFKNTGTASAAGMYALLYHNRNGIIVFDDSDGALADTDARNIIKAATDTKKVRKLVWTKKSSFIFDPENEDDEQYEDDPQMAPKFFDFKGRIIFISNLPLNKLDPDGALRTRAFVINVDPTDEELFERMEQILYKIKLEDGLTLSNEERRECMEVVRSSKRKGDVSLRKLVRALNLRASGAPNWARLVELYA